MKSVTSKNFIEMLTEEKPLICFFYQKEEAKLIKKTRDTIIAIEKKYPLLPSYEFVIDDDEKNIELTEHIGVANTPILIVFKDGCFSRYKDKQFTEKSLLQFIGNKKIYEKTTKQKLDY